MENRIVGRATILTAVTGLMFLACGCVAHVHRPDRYDAVVQRAGRSDDDLKRDLIDHPAEVLRLAGLRPGMKVADILAADGYFSELASDLVAPRGHVLLINNAAYEKWSNSGWRERLEHDRLPNVEHRQAELENMGLGERTIDAVLLIKVYHDLYWVNPKSIWPAVDAKRVLDDIARAVKPGGTLLLVDHSAVPGTGNADASRLHRIDENFARRDFESRGFELVGHSDVLRHPEDQRDKNSYKEPTILGKTDRFVLVFRKR